MTKLRVELDGPVRAGAFVLKDGEPATDILRIDLSLDPTRELQGIVLDRALVSDGRLYTTTEAGIITKATLTIEYEETQ